MAQSTSDQPKIVQKITSEQLSSRTRNLKKFLFSLSALGSLVTGDWFGFQWLRLVEIETGLQLVVDAEMDGAPTVSLPLFLLARGQKWKMLQLTVSPLYSRMELISPSHSFASSLTRWRWSVVVSRYWGRRESGLRMEEVECMRGLSVELEKRVYWPVRVVDDHAVRKCFWFAW